MHTIEGRTDIVKDPNTGAIINIDNAAHRSAVAGHKARQRAKEEIKNNTNEINSIKEEVSEIKLMMKQLLNRFDDDGR
tara:strand:+ start:147 stop:380 length:234 start_codon:yes stop_codon:yes gene_type:complete